MECIYQDLLKFIPGTGPPCPVFEIPILQEQRVDATVVHASHAVAEEAGGHQNQQEQDSDLPLMVVGVVGQPSGSNCSKKGETFTCWAIDDLNAASQMQQHCFDQ